MKILDAKRLMQAASGYRVHFEKREGCMLVSDHFPARDEPPIVTLADAWRLAEEWAKVDPRTYVNIYVIDALDWAPVDGYNERRLNSYPGRSVPSPAAKEEP